MEKILYNELKLNFEADLKDFTGSNINYVFIRLYDGSYSTKRTNAAFVIFQRTLKQSIDKIYDSTFYGLSYSHAACNYNLTDDYVGFTIKGVERECVYYKNNTEYADDTWVSVFAIPVSSKEYETFKSNLNKSIGKKDYVYNPIMLPTIGFNQIINKKSYNNLSDLGEDFKDIGNAVFKKSTTQNHEDYKKLVCSTFVLSQLMKASSRISKYIRDNKISPLLYSPSDLAKLPFVIHLYNHQLRDYETDTHYFVKKNPEFKKYFYTDD